MPGSVANAAPSTVLPQTLCYSFTVTREVPVQVNEYRDGTTHRRNQADSARKRWRLGKRISGTDLVTLRDFWDARLGGLHPFYFYDPYEPAAGQPIGSNYDATGVSTQGRVTVRFEGHWQQTMGPARGECAIEMVEIA